MNNNRYELLKRLALEQRVSVKKIYDTIVSSDIYLFIFIILSDGVNNL